MKKTIIFLVGYPRVGKDTAAAIMSEHLTLNGHGARAFSSIDPVRAMLRHVGIDVSAKSEADRKLLAVVGDAVEEHSHWRTSTLRFQIQAFFRQQAAQGDPSATAFVQIREPENMMRLAWSMKDECEYLVIKVVAPDREVRASNIADTRVDEFRPDIVIGNSGTRKQLSASCLSALVSAGILPGETENRVSGSLLTV